LCQVINLTLKSGLVPTDWKIGKVTPVFKSGSKNDIDNYRPITVLPVCSKVFEKCVHHQLMNFLEENKLLNKNQFGFRPSRNTEHAATLFSDTIRKNMNEGKLTGAIFIDLRKAFDTLNHSQIVSNLRSFGVNGIENELFTDYLFNRKQTVCFNKLFSRYESVTCGVPQGSILGPLLFLISFNDVAESLLHCEITMYADDTVIYVTGASVSEIEKQLSADFNRVVTWMADNELVVNAKKGKTESMLFGTSQKIKDKSLNITHNTQHLNCTNSYQYLGVTLDQSLQLSEHVNLMFRKASGRLYLLSRLRNQLTTKAALSIYTSLIVPLFSYCSILTCKTNKTHRDKLARLENRANRIIGNRQNIPSIEKLLKRKLCMEVFKSINKLNCENFNNYFDVMQNNTRNRNRLLRLPPAKLESYKKSFRFYGAKEFNSLPADTRAAKSKLEFLKYFE